MSTKLKTTTSKVKDTKPDSPKKPTKKSKKDKEKKRPPYQHAVYKSKVKCKKLFEMLDANKRKRLNKTEFCQGLQMIFDQEKIPVTELALNMLWEQVPKDVTGKYCGINEFLNRFLVDKSSNFKMAEKPKTDEDIKAQSAPKKIVLTDMKKIQEALYTVFKGWRYTSANLLKNTKSSSVYSRKEVRKVIVNMFTAERTEATAQGREPESWAIYYSVNEVDAEKMLDFVEWNRKEQAKLGDMIEGLERRIPAAKRVKPVEPEPVVTSFDVSESASSLPDYTLQSVSSESLRDWVADVLFHTQLAAKPQSSLRIGADRVTDEPLLAFPPLGHWDPEFTALHSVASLDDPRTERGGLLLFTHTVAVPAVKIYSSKTTIPGMKAAFVVYAQHLYCCQSTVDTSILQWRMRVKIYLDADERPIHIAIEDHEVWINGETISSDSTPAFKDWDFPNLPFQTKSE